MDSEPPPELPTSQPLYLAERVTVPIHVLPDDILLGIFDQYRGNNKYFTPKMLKPLVHVCRRWRDIIFASPRGLHLRLVCDSDVRTPVKELLDVWPAWPIIVRYSPGNKEGEGNVIAALEHHHHISRIAFRGLTSRVLGRFTAMMQEPFPTLTDLHLRSVDETRCVIPDAFLGRSAPQLQIFLLDGIAFPALPGLLASAIHLTKLRLEKIPDSGYIPPDVMATCLSVFLKLDELAITFQSPRPSPSQTPPPLTHAVLPALTYFRFGGDTRYLEDLISRIRAPNLDYLNIWFFMSPVVAVPQLCNFINGAEGLKELQRAYVVLDPWSVRLSLGPPTSLDLVTRCDRLDERVSWIVKLCDALSHLLGNVRCLEIHGGADSPSEPQGGVEPSQWLQLFRPFATVQGLYVTKKLGPLVAHALQEFTWERGTEVLPALRCLLLGGFDQYESVMKVMEPFIAARRLSDHPVVVENWEQDPYQEF